MDKSEQIFIKNNLSFSDSEVREFSDKIRKDGIVEVENAFLPWVIEEAQVFVKAKNAEINSGYITLRAEDMPHSIFNRIKESNHLRKFLDRIIEEGELPKANSPNIHCVVRSIDGTENINQKASNKYHFDAYDLTVSMPVLIPFEINNHAGDFVLFNRRRSTSHGLIKTLFYKGIFQNKYFQWMASSEFFFRVFKGRIVKTKPGSMYIFLGFRTYHGNRKIDTGLVRATALFHYSNPLHPNKIINFIEARRKRPQN